MVRPEERNESTGIQHPRGLHDRDTYGERQGLSKQTGTMVWMFGPDAKLSSVSSAWLAFRERTVEQERGEGWLEGVHPDDRERCTQSLRAAFLGRQDFQIEFRVLRADSSYSWVLASGVPQFLSDGRFVAYSGEIKEISVAGSGTLSSKLRRRTPRGSLRGFLRQIGKHSRRTTSNPPASQKAGPVNSIPAAGWLQCLNACSTPILALDRRGREVFSNAAAQLFAAKHAGTAAAAPEPKHHPLSHEAHFTASADQLGCTEVLRGWLNSKCRIDPRHIRINAHSLGGGLIAFSFIEISTEQQTVVQNPVFLHDLLNVATGIQVLVDHILVERPSAVESAECMSLLKVSLSQLFFEIERQRSLLENADLAARGHAG